MLDKIVCGVRTVDWLHQESITTLQLILFLLTHNINKTSSRVTKKISLTKPVEHYTMSCFPFRHKASSLGAEDSRLH